MYTRKLSKPMLIALFMAVSLFAARREADASERHVIQLRDFSQVEVKGAGFSLPHGVSVHIEALGAGKKREPDDEGTGMYAYGWIINADTRNRVWVMTVDNTNTQDKDRVFNGSVNLPAGNYEVYFAAYGFQTKSGFGTMEMNVDRREKRTKKSIEKDWGPFSWFYGFFTEDFYKDFEKRSKTWGINISLSDPTVDEVMFNVPKELPHVLFKMVKIGENDNQKQGFSLAKETKLRVYALGEFNSGDDQLADYGWIVSTKTYKRVWEMSDGYSNDAGGANKNKKVDETVTLPAGEYILTYVSDASHSYLDWNSAPPEDPFNYGITLMATNDEDKNNFKLVEAQEFKNVILQLTRVGDDETRNESFSLKEETDIRVYCVGERSTKTDMADYGWIINSKTRDKVWSMEANHTEHAGGGQKNRMVDEIITLPKGTYTVFYKTDDSHSYHDWNSDPPADPKRYGITIMGEGERFNKENVEKNVTAKREGVIAQIVQVQNDEKRSERFTVDTKSHIRVYSIGEGQNHEMFDYGWIENARNGVTVWEMTYGMTFHAGGARKNRSVNTTIVLEKGEYILHYVTDDSHSYHNWNSDEPDDPTMWGITLYKDDQ